MKWISHKIITLSFVFLATNDPVASFISALGSTFPDYIEGYHKGRIPKYHRTISHWFVWYIILTAFFFLLAKGNVSLKEFNFIFNMYSIAFWYFFGAFLHVIQDSITGKIPLFNPFVKDFSLKLFDTGSFYEYLLSLLMLFLFLYKIFDYFKIL
ncbi:MAG: metal-dependent hydrolase [bacterium]